MGRKVKLIVDVTELGRQGGRATAANRTPEERKAAAQLAVEARWAAYYAAHPDKLKAKLEREARKGKVKRGRPPQKKANPPAAP
jgi:hypothetical protein